MLLEDQPAISFSKEEKEAVIIQTSKHKSDVKIRIDQMHMVSNHITVEELVKKGLVKVKSGDIYTDYYLVDVTQLNKYIKWDASSFKACKDYNSRRNYGTS